MQHLLADLHALAAIGLWLAEQLARVAGNGVTAAMHQLRHSHATELVNDGISLQIIRKRLGHPTCKPPSGTPNNQISSPTTNSAPGNAATLPVPAYSGPQPPTVLVGLRLGPLRRLKRRGGFAVPRSGGLDARGSG